MCLRMILVRDLVQNSAHTLLFGYFATLSKVNSVLSPSTRCLGDIFDLNTHLIDLHLHNYICAVVNGSQLAKYEKEYS